MIKFIASAIVGAVLGALLFIPNSASADPEIGEPAAGYVLPITTLDTSGDDSVLRDWTPADKHISLTVWIKRGTPGRFTNVGKSFARIKLRTGEVLKARGYSDDARRRIVFILAPEVPSGNFKIKRSAKRFVVVTTNDPRAKPVVGSVGSFGIYSESS